MKTGSAQQVLEWIQKYVDEHRKNPTVDEIIEQLENEAKHDDNLNSNMIAECEALMSLSEQLQDHIKRLYDTLTPGLTVR
jgi:hypothetical protein